MSTYKPLLDHVNKYIDLTFSEAEEFTSVLIETETKKGGYLVKPGMMVDRLYYVRNGCLKSYYLNETGNKHILQFAIEDWWITDFEAMQNGAPSQLYIEAIEDCHLLGLKINTMEELFVRIPKFERFFRLLYTNAFIALRKRTMSALLKSNKDRYVEFCHNYPDLAKRVNNYHIANYLGITGESLSRVLKEPKL